MLNILLTSLMQIEFKFAQKQMLFKSVDKLNNINNLFNVNIIKQSNQRYQLQPRKQVHSRIKRVRQNRSAIRLAS